MDLGHEIVKKDYQITKLKGQFDSIKDQTDRNIEAIKRTFSLLESFEKISESLLDTNEQLNIELQSLRMRSKLSGENLTPRPNYSKICADKKINLSALVEGIHIIVLFVASTELI